MWLTEINAPLSARAIHRKPACRRPKGCARGEKAGGCFNGRPEEAETRRAATEGNLPPVMPQGNLVEVLGREVRQGSPGELLVESSPSRQRNHLKQKRRCQMRLRTRPPLLTYLLTYLLMDTYM